MTCRLPSGAGIENVSGVTLLELYGSGPRSRHGRSSLALWPHI
jgi:hypothetical protein